MNPIKPSRPYHFNELKELLWRYRDPKYIGPMPLINDPILVAGLLFVPHNSWSTRIITTSPYYYNGLPYVSVAIHQDFTESDYQKIPTTNEMRKLLLEEAYVEGTPYPGFRDTNQLKLSHKGKKAVVTEWFKESANVLDYIAAGASIHANGRTTL